MLGSNGLAREPWGNAEESEEFFPKWPVTPSRGGSAWCDKRAQNLGAGFWGSATAVICRNIVPDDFKGENPRAEGYRYSLVYAANESTPKPNR